MASAFHWRSFLGVGVILFLLAGLVNVFFAVFVPVSLHQGGPGAMGAFGLVMSEATDAQVLGRSLADIGRQDPGLSAYLVAFMDTMCSMMMPLGILQLAVAWFALRAGQRWALGASAIAGFASLPYFNLAIPALYAGRGVPVGQVYAEAGAFLVGFPLVLAVVPTILGWIGLSRQAAGTTI